MKLRLDEPSAEPWRVIAVGDFVAWLFDRVQKPEGRPRILAVDGWSGGGKSTAADALHGFVASSAVIHTDDVAWHHSFFDWSDLLIEGLLKPLREGQSVRYQPPGWLKKGRPGAIEIACGLELVVVEGCGASRSEVLPYIDGSIWVQSDYEEADRRGIERDGGTQEEIDFWHEWMDAEIFFMQRERPWERAMAILNGTPSQAVEQNSELVVSAANSGLNFGN